MSSSVQQQSQSPRRRLRPDARKILVERLRRGVEDLYQRPVEELTPEEIRLMKAAFFSR